MRQPLVSTVVLTRDRPESLWRCLESLRANRYRPLEIVVVDNGSETTRESLRARFRDWGGDPPLTHVERPPLGFAALRQCGVERARGEIVVSIDDDCEAADDMIERVVARFREEPRLGMLGGAIENVGFEGAERFKGRGRIGVNGRYEPVEDPRLAEVFGSANQSVRKVAFDEVGGYDPFFRDGMEEADLALALAAAGWRIGFAPEVRVVHRHVPQRFRRRWRNLHRMRLYLYFKYRCPRGGEWLGFLAREAALAVREVAALWGGRPHGAARALVWGAVELTKIVVARLTLPWIWHAARRA